MATSQDAIRRLTIQTSAPGADQAAASLRGVKEELGGVTVASQQTEKATLNLDRSFSSIERRYVAQTRAQQDLEKVQRMVNAAVAQNPALQDRANTVLAAAAERFRIATGAANDNAIALARHAAETERAAAAQTRMAAAQAAANRFAGVSAPGGSETRGADIEAYAAAMDRLQAKYDPLFAAGLRYKVALDDINQAQRVGAISTQIATQARLKEVNSYNAEVSALNGVAQARKVAAQASVNQQTIVPDRGADIAAYGTELDRLRAKFNPLFAAEQEHKALTDEINQSLKVGAIDQQEHSSAVTRANAAYQNQVKSLGGVAGASGLARHELINLSRQAQDVVVSLQGGQGFGTVMLQQGSQIADVFVSSKSSVGDFAKQSIGWLGSFLTAGRVAFGGTALAITGAAFALNSYLDSQQKVQMSLLGAGRASGQSVSSINAMAQSGSSLTGFSVTEARAFAAELASTGKIGRDNLQPIVKIGHDISTVFGIDAAEAARMLGKAYADPVRGAEQLNERLGFLDAAMQRQITNLVAQNRVWEAQRLLQAGVESSLAGVSEATSTSTKFWTALGNAASNAWDAIGAGLSRVTGIGLKLGLDEQIATAQSRLDSFKKDLETAQEYAKALGPDGSKGVDTGYDAAIAGVQKWSSEVEKLTATQKHNFDATQAAQDRQRSFAQEGALRSALPDIAQVEALKNQVVTLQGAVEDTKREMAGLFPDEATGDRLKTMTDLLQKFQQALSVVTTKIDALPNQKLVDFLGNAASPAERLRATLDQIAIKAKEINASPADVGRANASAGLDTSIGVQQARNSALGQSVTVMDTVKARMLEIQRLQTQGAGLTLAEVANQRRLAEEQAIGVTALKQQADAYRVASDTIGMGVGKTAEYYAWKTKELEAIRNGAPLKDAELARLKEEARLLGEVAQKNAIKAAQSQATFTGQTMFMSQADVAAAQVMHNLYGDEWQSHMDDALAKQIKMNSLLQQVNGLAGTAFSSIAKDLANGVAPAQAIAKATKAAAESVLDIAAKQIVGNLIGSVMGDVLGAGAGQTAGATTAATILTTAGGAVAASIVAGATEAASILGLTVPTAAATLPAAGAVTGGEVAAGGIAAGLALTLGGTAAGWALWGPIALLAAAVAAIGALTFGDSDDKKKQDAARVQALNNRATLAGLDQSTLQGQLTAFDLSANVERTALPNGGKTEKSWSNTLSFGLFGDGGGETTEEAIALEKALAAERLKVIDDFNKKAIETERQRVEAATKMMNDAVAMLDNVTMSDTAERLKDIQTATGDLSTALVELGQSTDMVADKVAAAMADLRKTFSESLSARLNSANGMGYLNDAADLLKKYQQDSADAASIGVDQMQVAAVFRAEAQKIVDDAGLIGDSFGDFIRLFPQLAGVVDQSSVAIKAASDKIQSFVKSINDYLNGLKVGANSILSPQAQLAAAQSNFNAQLTLAKAGNEDALGSITGVATTLLDQAKSFYASSAGYTDIYNQVTSALQALTNIGSTTGISVDAVAIVKAVNTTGAQADALAAAQNALSLSQVNYLQAQQTLLSAIRDLSGATRDQVSLLKAQLTNSDQSSSFVVYAGRSDNVTTLTTTNSNLLTALNKIVVNTYATSLNTYALAQISDAKELSHGVGALASGGWITGGVQGRDSVMLASGNALGMPGEFVVRHDVAQANRGWLDDFNRTGRLPMVSARNDNGRATSDNGSREIGEALNRQTQILAQTLAQGDPELREAVADMKREIKSLNSKLSLVLAAA